MKEELKNKIIEVANYIIENKVTINECSEHFNISVSSIKKYINNEDKLQSIDINLYNRVKEVQSEIIKQGNIKGGKLGKKISPDIYSDFEIEEIMDEMLEKSLTLQEASNVFDIPISSLYERIINSSNTEKVDKVKELFIINKSGAFDSVNSIEM